MPDSGPARIKGAWLDHARVIMDSNANILPITRRLHPKGEKLWRKLLQFDRRFLIDSNIDWEACAERRTLRNTAFILGSTISNERTKFLSFFEDRHGRRKAFRNVFLFGVQNVTALREGEFFNAQLIVDALDERVLSVFDRQKSAEIQNFKTLANLPERPSENEAEMRSLGTLIKSEIVRLLRFRAGMPALPSLTNSIADWARRSFLNYSASIETARRCLAKLLVQDGESRNKLKADGSLNAFFDAAVIKDALFFGAEVISDDKGVRKMARYAGLKAGSSSEILRDNNIRLSDSD